MFSKNRPSRIPLKWSLLTCGGMVGKKKQSIEKQTVVQQGGTPLLLFTLLHHLQRLCTNQWGNMDLEISKVSHSSSQEPKIDSNRTFHIPNGYIQYIQSEIKYISFFFSPFTVKHFHVCITLPITNEVIVKIQVCNLLEKYQLVPDSGLCSVKILTNSI